MTWPTFDIDKTGSAFPFSPFPQIEVENLGQANMMPLKALVYNKIKSWSLMMKLLENCLLKCRIEKKLRSFY